MTFALTRGLGGSDNRPVIHRSTRLIAPISLGLAGLLLLVMSSPPWFNAIWGEESGVSWSGIALAVPQLVLAAFMLRGSGVATVIGVAIAAALLLLNLLLLVLATGSPPGTEVFATTSALYALVIAGVMVETWRSGEEPISLATRSTAARCPAHGCPAGCDCALVRRPTG